MDKNGSQSQIHKSVIDLLRTAGLEGRVPESNIQHIVGMLMNHHLPTEDLLTFLLQEGQPDTNPKTSTNIDGSSLSHEIPKTTIKVEASNTELPSASTNCHDETASDQAVSKCKEEIKEETELQGSQHQNIDVLSDHTSVLDEKPNLQRSALDTESLVDLHCCQSEASLESSSKSNSIWTHNSEQKITASTISVGSEWRRVEAGTSEARGTFSQDFVKMDCDDSGESSNVAQDERPSVGMDPLTACANLSQHQFSSAHRLCNVNPEALEADNSPNSKSLDDKTPLRYSPQAETLEQENISIKAENTLMEDSYSGKNDENLEDSDSCDNFSDATEKMDHDFNEESDDISSRTRLRRGNKTRIKCDDSPQGIARTKDEDNMKDNDSGETAARDGSENDSSSSWDEAECREDDEDAGSPLEAEDGLELSPSTDLVATTTEGSEYVEGYFIGPCHAASRGYCCPVCRKMFSSCLELKRHQVYRMNKHGHKCSTLRKYNSPGCSLASSTQPATATVGKRAGDRLCSKLVCSGQELRVRVRGRRRGNCSKPSNCEGQTVLKETGTRTSNHEKAYACAICQKSYILIQSLRRHLRNYHWKKRRELKGQLSVCSICGKSTTSYNEWIVHQETHVIKLKTKTNINKNKYKCSICGDSYSTLRILHRHWRNHPEMRERPADCPICGKISTSYKKWFRHQRNHLFETKRKTFVCSVCGKDFMNKTALESHKREHRVKGQESGKTTTNNRERYSHVCSLCGLTFSYPRSMYEHWRKHPEILAGKLPACSICGVTSTALNEWFKHQKSHLKFVCPICEKHFSSNRELLSHKRTDHEIGVKQPKLKLKDDSYVCTICGETYGGPKILYEHWQAHPELLEEKLPACCICKKSFISLAEWYTHQTKHFKNKKIVCSQCGRILGLSYYTQHRRTHDIQRPAKRIMCSICGKTFPNTPLLKDHELIHTDERSFECTVCGKKFHTNGQLYFHKRSNHTVKDKLCTTCGKAFKTKYTLRNHEESHSASRQFKCTVCTKAFKTKYCLKQHMKTHRGEDSYTEKCTVCGKMLATKCGLAIHMKIHSGVKAYVCSVADCGKAFHSINNLRKHEKVHAGVRPYECSYCSKTFSTRWNMRQHVSKVHEK